MSQKTISACSFYQKLGRVMMATTKIFNYDLKTDRDVKIRNDQQNAIARDYIRELTRQFQANGFEQENNFEIKE